MAHKCTSRGCEFSLPDSYPLDKCPWHMVPGRGPVKIAAALAVAAAGLGGGLAYKKYKTYLHEKQLRKERRQRDAAASERGVLKRMVPMWLGTAEFRSYVSGFESAAVGHGGEGALYVTLRKSR